MTSERTSSRTVLAAIGWFAGGVLVAAWILVDPWDLHSLDERRADPPAAVAEPPSAEEATLWTCGMHPHVLEEEPGSCPICHMDLVPLTFGMDATGEDSAAEDGDPVAAGSSTTAAAVRIDPGVVQNMNVRSAPVELRQLRHPIRTVGYLEYDQERMVTVTTKYSGWIEKVHVNYVGEPVRQGQPLFEIYSPELVQTQLELLSARSYAHRMTDTPSETHLRAAGLVEAARARLSYWDISHEQIAQLEETGEVLRTLTVRAPASGVVMKRMRALEGAGVQPGMETYHIADLSMMWLSVEVFEDQISWIREGTPAEATFTYFPGETFRGKVSFIEPELSERTRTLRVKIGVANPGRRLRSGMYATVSFQPPAVAAALVIPDEAVLRTGTRNVAVVELEGGFFLPREITTGYESDGWVEVLAGLEEGERVVTSSQFLLDSESRLRQAIQKMIAARSAAPAAAGGN